MLLGDETISERASWPRERREAHTGADPPVRVWGSEDGGWVVGALRHRRCWGQDFLERRSASPP